MTIEDLWSSLEGDIEQVAANEWLARRLVPNSRCDIRIGVDGQSRSRAILVRLDRSVIHGIERFPRARGFDVRVMELPGDVPTHQTLSVVLSNRSYLDVFTVLAADVADRLARCENDRIAFSELIARLCSWQQFMENAAPDGLDAQSVRGLYGELYFLRHFLIPVLGGRRAVGSWLGPSRMHQDFQVGTYAFEVKTATAKQHQFLRIASERQLDVGALEGIVLFHLSLDVRPQQGENLNEMIVAVKELLGGDAIALECLATKLVEYGFLDLQSSNYERDHYSIRETNFFDVRGEFPRIVESDLRSGVGDVTYSISVAECRHYQVAVSRVMQILGVSRDE